MARLEVTVGGLVAVGWLPGDWIVAPEGLDGWTDGAEVEAQTTPRPGAHGTFGERAWRRGRQVVVTAHALATDVVEAGVRRRQAAAVLAEGMYSTLTVTELDGQTTTAEVRLDARPLVTWLQDEETVRAQWTFYSDDPLRYGPAQIASTGFAIDQSGLEFDLFTDGTTDTGYLEFGDPGALTGTVTLLNSGTAPAPWSATVNGPVPDAGFELVSIGRTVRYSRGVPSGSVLTIDSATGRASLDGSDVTRYLTLKEFVQVPPGGSLDLLFRPIEGASSAVLTVTARPAWW